jgi:hypothetical protein
MSRETSREGVMVTKTPGSGLYAASGAAIPAQRGQIAVISTGWT